MDDSTKGGLDESVIEDGLTPEINESTSAQNEAIQIFSTDAFAHALSGATASVLAMSTFFPLDTIRTRLQVEDKERTKNTLQIFKEICQKEGFSTLYKGLVPVLSSLYCSNFVYFYTFHGIKKILQSQEVKQRPALDLILGYFAGLVNSVLTTPLWVANTRLKLQGLKKVGGENGDNAKQPYTGLINAVQRIANEEGITALWRGVQTSFLLSANPAIQFMFYEAIKRFVHRLKRVDAGKSKKISSVEYFIMGGAAKAVATVLTYPLQLAQCRLRASKEAVTKSTRGIYSMLLQIYKDRGIVGLYKGLEAKLMQTVLTAALMFLVYEKVISFIFKLLKLKK